MLVVDFMHEFELGVWKTLFMHLIRILYAAAPGGKLVAILDERYDDILFLYYYGLLMKQRYRHIPQFSQAIRRFTNNVSGMKKLAARDFEDLLQVTSHSLNIGPRYLHGTYQCSIPAFEGLLNEPHNNRLMKLLYRTAEWHGFAKLRMHTDSTLEHLQSITKEFGHLMRQFRKRSCSQFQTFELPREAAARNRNQQRILANVPTTEHQHDVAPVQVRTQSESNSTKTRKAKSLNLSTTKFHFLGDYVCTIQMFGCTDSYSTQLV